MNRIPSGELNAFRRIESHFDGAYLSLLNKLGHLKIEQADQPKQDESECFSEADEQGDSNQKSNETSDSQTETSADEQSGEDQIDEYKLDSVETELLTLALSFAKLMTKSLLAIERAANLESQVGQLQRENCTLRAIAKNCHQLCLTKKDDHSKVHKSKTANLIAFKAAIEEEIDNLIENQNKSMQRLERKYKNQIFGLTMAVDYLKKELAGRVQQLQIFDKLLQDNGIGESKMKETPGLTNIWNQIICEICLNRHKTIIRLSEKACQEQESELSEQDENTEMDSLCSMLVNGCSLTGPQLVDFTKLGQVRFVSIYVEKGKPLGLWISGGNEHFMPLVIQRVLPNSLSEKSGQLCPGDIILSIQNFDMIGATQEYAAQLLKSISGWCRLGIVRIPVNDVVNCLSNQNNFELLFGDFPIESDHSEKVTELESENDSENDSDSGSDSVSDSESSTNCSAHSE